MVRTLCCNMLQLYAAVWADPECLAVIPRSSISTAGQVSIKSNQEQKCRDVWLRDVLRHCSLTAVACGLANSAQLPSAKERLLSLLSDRFRSSGM